MRVCVRVYVCMYVWVHVWVYVCMCVCVDVRSFGLVVMACALGRVPLPVSDGYWGVLEAVTELPSPTLADKQRYVLRGMRHATCTSPNHQSSPSVRAARARALTHATCRMPHATYRIPHASYGMWYVACGMWHEACGMWLAACGMWHVA